jgi:hypothetical protein
MTFTPLDQPRRRQGPTTPAPRLQVLQGGRSLPVEEPIDPSMPETSSGGDNVIALQEHFLIKQLCNVRQSRPTPGALVLLRVSKPRQASRKGA